MNASADVGMPAARVVDAVLLGEVLYARGDFQGAADAFADAAAASDSDAYLTRRLSEATAQLGAVGKGEPKPSPSVPIRFDPADRPSAEGRAASARADDKAAAAMLLIALRRNPGRTADRRLLIEVLLRQDRVADARFHIDSLPPPEDTVSSVIDRSRLLLRAGMYREARALLYDYVGSTAPGPGELRSLLAATECALGRPEAAFALTEQSVSAETAAAECAALLGATVVHEGASL